ncbi:MAG: phosphate ABC transporter, permease protein PstA, partial [Propionibacteriaceae bacterium]|nr:phosphate ABC transporter, permease protein PstA [Propionibacteriaceae bacterium]
MSTATTMGGISARRKVTNNIATAFVVGFFVLALIPLGSLLWTVISRGLARLDMTFFTYSMRGVVGDGGGA